MTTNPDLDPARMDGEERRYANGCRVTLPDEWVDADKLRGVIGRWDALLADDDHEDMHGMLDDLRALLPTPKPRTLADMTPEEREACQWMQARLGDSDIVLTQVTNTYAVYVYRSGTTGIRTCTWFDQITPLPDLPRMVWPEEQATEEDMSIIPPKIDTSTGHDDDVDMTPEDAPDGYYLVRWWGEEYPVPAEKVQDQWWVIGKPTMLFARDIIIVSRLVPEEERATEETPDPPRPEDAKLDPQPGEAWLIEYEGGYYDAVYWHSPIYAHAYWALATSREGLKTVESGEAKALRRLVTDGEERA